MKRRSIFFISLFVIEIVAILVIAEVALRAVPSRFRGTLEREQYIRTRAILQYEFCEEDPNPRLRWRNIPGKEGIFENKEFSVHIRINQSGNRGPEVGEKNRPRVLLLGDSETFGWGVEDDATFSARLTALRPDWEFINAAVSGYSTVQERARLQEIGPSLRPDSVWLIFYPNDPVECFLPVLHLKPSPPRFRDYWYLFQLYRTLRKVLFYPPEPPYYTVNNPAMWRVAAANINGIRDWCAAHNTQFRVVYLPFKDELKEPVPVGFHQAFLSGCQSEKWTCLDLTPLLSVPPQLSAAYFVLDDHLTAEGHRWVAKELNARLLNGRPATPR